MSLVRLIFRQWLLVLIALLTGVILHIGTVLAIPSITSNSAFARIADDNPANTINVLDAITPDNQPLPFMAPDVRYAICHYDLSAGPVVVRTSLANEAWTIALYNRLGENFYTLSGADLQRPNIELILAPADDAGAANPIPLGRDTGQSAVTVSVGETEGIAIIRAPIRGAGYVDQTETTLADATCSARADGSSQKDETPLGTGKIK